MKKHFFGWVTLFAAFILMLVPGQLVINYHNSVPSQFNQYVSFWNGNWATMGVFFMTLIILMLNIAYFCFDDTLNRYIKTWALQIFILVINLLLAIFFLGSLAYIPWNKFNVLSVVILLFIFIYLISDCTLRIMSLIKNRDQIKINVVKKSKKDDQFE